MSRLAEFLEGETEPQLSLPGMRLPMTSADGLARAPRRFFGDRMPQNVVRSATFYVELAQA
jgi:hypothetical protein